ncbi:MAG: (deoxy)nucleoside triphosphate pyrophosphohydrolase [Candidatus Kapaibacterium sp.]
MSSDPVVEISVAVGILVRGASVLICQRKRGSRYGLKWEFPGGKRERGEDDVDTLRRELFEELSIRASDITHIRTESSSYADGGVFSVRFHLVHAWDGECTNNVFEDIRWVEASALGEYDMLAGTIDLCAELPSILASIPKRGAADV